MPTTRPVNTDEQRRREHEATAPHGDENLIADLTVVKADNGPHDIGWTYPAETNATMLESPGANAKRQRAGGGDRHVALDRAAAWATTAAARAGAA